MTSPSYKYGMRRFMQIVEDAQSGPLMLYHLTTKANFKLNPNYEPEDNAVALHDRSGNRGIYLCRNVETWVNGHGYWRPFVAEIQADPSVIDRDRVGRWGGEIFVSADDFDKLTVTRVVPIDAWCREHFNEYGWLEDAIGKKFDTGEDIQRRKWDEPYRPSFPDGYRYEHDVRQLPAEEVKRLRQHFTRGHKARLRG